MNLSDIPITPELLERNPELAGLIKGQKPASKYKNARTESQGMTFDSGKEAARISELILLEERHEIFALRLQVRFPLHGGVSYVADACYCTLRDGKLTLVIEDAKGFKNQLYRVKKKQFQEKYQIKIEEV